MYSLPILITDKAATPNFIAEQLSGDAPGLIAMEFTDDDLSPVLQNFTFNAANGTITLTFDEPVDSDRFDSLLVFTSREHRTPPTFILSLEDLPACFQLMW